MFPLKFGPTFKASIGAPLQSGRIAFDFGDWETDVTQDDELDKLRSAYDTLRAACKDAPNVIYGAAILLRHVEEFQAADTLVAKADGIAAALAAPANGDGDGVK
jgi:hypothetical protein